MYLTYKYRIYPNQKEKEKINYFIECSKAVRNKCIQNNEVDQVRVSAKKLVDRYIEEDSYLKECDYSVLMNSLFKAADEKRSSFTDSRNSYSTTYRYIKGKYKIPDNQIYLPKIGYIKYKNSRPIPSDYDIYKLTIKVNKIGEYYALFSLSTPKTTISKELDSNKSIGLDYSSTHFIIDNNGKRYDLPESISKLNKKIKNKNKLLKKKTKGSSRYHQIKAEINKLYNKITNIRLDYFQKLATELFEQYDYVFVENLDMKGMQSRFNLLEATKNNSYSTFLNILSYKADKHHKRMIKIDRWYPSTKTCHVCGYINPNIDLSTRNWICPNCGVHLDRDINAAINIQQKGLEQI